MVKAIKATAKEEQRSGWLRLALAMATDEEETAATPRLPEETQAKKRAEQADPDRNAQEDIEEYHRIKLAR